MRIKLGSGLLQINLLALLLVLVIVFNLSDVFRIILGLPFLLFFPGYSLLLIPFPTRERIGALERVALSFGISIIIVPLIGLLLNYMPWGIRLEPVLYSVTSVTLAMSIIAWLRLRKLAVPDRFSISFDLKMPFGGNNTWERVLSLILVIAIAGALATSGYVIATTKVGERFTEFYILGETGKAANYPAELRVGEEAKVIIGIINHEPETKSYRVEVWMGGVRINEVGPVVLVPEGKWEQGVGFTPNVAGENQKVEFLLYQEGVTEPPEESLHLWVNVTD